MATYFIMDVAFQSAERFRVKVRAQSHLDSDRKGLHMSPGCPLRPSSIARTISEAHSLRSAMATLKLQKHQQKHVSRSVRSRVP
jgi:hypothetical protein